jgi:hypothetical protein
LSRERETFKSAGLAVEGTRLIAGNVKVDIFLVHLLVPVHAILLRVIPHGVIPPVEERIRLSVVHRVPVTAPGVLLYLAAGHIIDYAVPLQGIEEQKKTGLVVILLVDSRIFVRLNRQRVSGRGRARTQECSERDNDQSHSSQSLHQYTSEVATSLPNTVNDRARRTAVWFRVGGARAS